MVVNQEPHRMTPRQIDLIRTSWSAVEPISDAAARHFYGRLFESDPAIKRLFAKTDMQAQRGILMQTLALLVSSLDDFERVVPVLEALGRVHAGYGVRQRHYDTVEAALLWALDRGLGVAFDDETADAWATAYSAVASVMIEAASDVVDESAA
jgi:hemoglobin-like flavoprotein